jgi:hypothetical protein
MNFYSVGDVAAVLILIAVFATAVLKWRNEVQQARENPVGTGHVLAGLDSHNARITAIEEHLKGVATHADLASLKGDVKALGQKIDGVERVGELTHEAVVRMEDYMRNSRGN